MKPTPVGDLLPHFTLMLEVELRQRLRARIIEDFPVAAFGAEGKPLGYVNEAQTDGIEIKYGTPDQLATALVRRIYRTQAKAAEQAASFADAMLTWEERRLAALKRAAEKPKLTFAEAVAQMDKSSFLIANAKASPGRLLLDTKALLRPHLLA